MIAFGNVINSINGIVDWITNAVSQFNGIWEGIDFTLLYSWLPNDIQGVITASIAVLLFLAVFGILKKLLFFLG